MFVKISKRRFGETTTTTVSDLGRGTAQCVHPHTPDIGARSSQAHGSFAARGHVPAVSRMVLRVPGVDVRRDPHLFSRPVPTRRRRRGGVRRAGANGAVPETPRRVRRSRDGRHRRRAYAVVRRGRRRGQSDEARPRGVRRRFAGFGSGRRAARGCARRAGVFIGESAGDGFRLRVARGKREAAGTARAVAAC